MEREEQMLLDSIAESKDQSVKLEKKDMTVRWKDVPSKKRHFSQKDSVSDWSSRDCFLYLREQLQSRFGIKSLFTSIPSGSAKMKEIADRLQSARNKPTDKTTLKRYIDWFLVNECRRFIEKYGNVRMKYLSYPTVIEKFAQIVSLDPLPKQNKEQAADLSYDVLDASYSLSRIHMVKRYGVIMPVAFLVSCYKMSVSIAVETVADAMRKAVSADADSASAIYENTKKYQPYPWKYRFAGLSSVIKEVAKASGRTDEIKIAFSHSAPAPAFEEKER